MKYHEGYEGQIFINMWTLKTFTDINEYNKQWYVKDSPAWKYFDALTKEELCNI